MRRWAASSTAGRHCALTAPGTRAIQEVSGHSTSMAHAARPDAPAPPAPASRVLIVDDDRDSAAALAELLVRAGRDTRTCHEGRRVPAMVSEYRPDAVLLDIGLPDLDGFKVCRLVRELPEGPGVLMIAVTGWNRAQDRILAEAAGFDAHVGKPVDPSEVVALMDRLLQDRGDGARAPHVP
jgi:two-component system OmpR family response regulator